MADVLIAIPGSRNGFDASFSFRICAISAARVRFSPAAFSTLTVS